MTYELMDCAQTACMQERSRTANAFASRAILPKFSVSWAPQWHPHVIVKDKTGNREAFQTIYLVWPASKTTSARKSKTLFSKHKKVLFIGHTAC